MYILPDAMHILSIYTYPKNCIRQIWPEKIRTP